MNSDDDEPRSLQLRDMPEEELPREKLLRHGRARLSDEELIALFLRTGLRGCNVLELAAKIKREAGSLAALGAMEAADIADICKGIGPAKAATLAAVFELGQRAAKERVSAQDMRDPAAVYEYLAPELRFEPQECAVLLLMDARGMLIRRVDISRGSLASVSIHPRNVFSPVIRYNAHSFTLVHNHPSGDPTPSQSDRHLTAELVKASKILLIKFRDHVVLGASSPERVLPYFSFGEHGFMG